MEKAPRLSELEMNQSKLITALDLTHYYCVYADYFHNACKNSKGKSDEKVLSYSCITHLFLLLEGYAKNLWVKLALEKDNIEVQALEVYKGLDFSQRIFNIGPYFKINGYASNRSKEPWVFVNEVHELRNIFMHPGWSSKYLYDVVITKNARGSNGHEMVNSINGLNDWG